MFRRPAEGGFTLIETLVALVVVLGALLFGMSLLWQQPRVLQRLEAQRQAYRALEFTLEEIRATRVPPSPGRVSSPVPAPNGVEEYQLFVGVEPTDVPGLYDITLEARYELQHHSWRRRLETRLYRP